MNAATRPLDLVTIAPGIYHDLSNEQYHSGPGVSKSQLDDIAESPATYIWRKNAPVDTEKLQALDMGTALHCLLLEPDEFDSRFIKAPDFNRRTKDGKAEEAPITRTQRRLSGLLEAFNALTLAQGSG